MTTKKTVEPVTAYMKPERAKKLRRLSKDMGMSVSAMVNMAIWEMFFKDESEDSEKESA